MFSKIPYHGGSSALLSRALNRNRWTFGRNGSSGFSSTVGPARRGAGMRYTGCEKMDQHTKNR